MKQIQFLILFITSLLLLAPTAEAGFFNLFKDKPAGEKLPMHEKIDKAVRTFKEKVVDPIKKIKREIIIEPIKKLKNFIFHKHHRY